MSLEESSKSEDSDEGLNVLYRQVHDYPLIRSRSEVYHQEGNVVRLKERLVELEKSLTELKWRVERMEESTGTQTRWAVRYSQRMALVANVLLGFWHFWIEFVFLIQKRRRVIVQSFLQKHSQTSNQLNSVLSDAYQFAVWKSSYFLICALLISSMSNWKRIAGLVISSFGALYFSPKHPTGNYFTLFANILYATAAWSTGYSSQSNSLWENIKKKLLQI